MTLEPEKDKWCAWDTYFAAAIAGAAADPESVSANGVAKFAACVADAAVAERAKRVKEAKNAESE